MDRLLQLVGRSGKDTRGSGPEPSGSDCEALNVIDGNKIESHAPDGNNIAASRQVDGTSTFSQSSFEGMNVSEDTTIILTSDNIEGLISSNIQTSQSDIYLKTASQSKCSSLSTSRRSSQSELSSHYSSYHDSQSDFSFLCGSSRRSSQSDFASAAASRRSSQSDISSTSAYSKSIKRKDGKSGSEQYNRFDLQFIAHVLESSDFYVKVIVFLPPSYFCP